MCQVKGSATMMFLEKGMYAIAALLFVYFGAFEPDATDEVFVDVPVSETSKLHTLPVTDASTQLTN